jgi:hypothetical protein
MQNLNGLGDKAHAIGQRCNDLHVHIIGLIETNTDWNWGQKKQETIQILRNHFKRTTFSFANSAIHFSSAYQPGGSCTFATDEWSPRANPSSDPHDMGRWSSISITGRDHTNVSIFTVYRVGPNAFSTAYERTAFRQQYIMLENRNQHPINPRQAVLTDLGLEITKLQDKGHGIVVLIDANETICPHATKL